MRGAFWIVLFVYGLPLDRIIIDWQGLFSRGVFWSTVFFSCLSMWRDISPQDQVMVSVYGLSTWRDISFRYQA